MNLTALEGVYSNISDLVTSNFETRINQTLLEISQFIMISPGNETITASLHSPNLTNINEIGCAWTSVS